MRTRSQARKRRQQQVRQTSVESPNLEKPNNNPPIVTMDDNRTMAQLLEAPTEGYEDAIVVPEINANNFEIKHGLLNLVQNKQFFGHDKEDPHAHIRYFNKITSTMKFLNVPTNPKFANPQKQTRVATKWSASTSTSGISPDVSELKDMVKALLLDKKNQSQAPAHQTPKPADRKSVAESCCHCANDAVMRNVQNQGQNLQAQLNNLATSNQRLESMPRYHHPNVVVAYQDPAIPSTSSSPPKVMNRDTEVTKDTMLPTLPTEALKMSNLRLFKSNLKIQLPSQLLILDLSFEISFTDALTLMPKFASTLKTLIGNKEKLSEMARTLLNKNCSAVMLNKLPKKLGDPGRFLHFHEKFFGIKYKNALADLGPALILCHTPSERPLSSRTNPDLHDAKASRPFNH
ncbi:hypothetical protein Tco_0661767 [Tanacetum coccineum]